MRSKDTEGRIKPPGVKGQIVEACGRSRNGSAFDLSRLPTAEERLGFVPEIRGLRRHGPERRLGLRPGLRRLLGGLQQKEATYFYYLARGSRDSLVAQVDDGLKAGFEVFYLKVQAETQPRAVALTLAICRQLQAQLAELREAKAT